MELVWPLGYQADRELVGGKASGLQRAIDAGFDVPRGWVVPLPVIRNHTDSCSSQDARRRCPDNLLRRELTAATTSLLGSEGTPSVIVRSSSPYEDSADASHAGIFQSYSGLRTTEEVVAAFSLCAAQGESSTVDDPMMPVVIQREIESAFGGVAMSLDPSTGDRSVVAIEWAQSPSAVTDPDGSAPVARCTVDKLSGRITSGQDLSGATNPLPEDAIRAISRSVESARKVWNAHVDVEWAVDGYRHATDPWILQIRHETYWSAK